MVEPEDPREEPMDRMVEKPDLDALRESFRHPSRWALRRQRVMSALRNTTLWTFVLAAAIIAALVFGYLALT